MATLGDPQWPRFDPRKALRPTYNPRYNFSNTPIGKWAEKWVWTSQLKMAITFDPDVYLEPTSTQNDYLKKIFPIFFEIDYAFRIDYEKHNWFRNGFWPKFLSAEAQTHRAKSVWVWVLEKYQKPKSIVKSVIGLEGIFGEKILQKFKREFLLLNIILVYLKAQKCLSIYHMPILRPWMLLPSIKGNFFLLNLSIQGI